MLTSFAINIQIAASTAKWRVNGEKRNISTSYPQKHASRVLWADKFITGTTATFFDMQDATHM
jgi:hypothetical protein